MGCKVEKSLEREGKVSGVELDSEDRINADMIFMNVGIGSNIELATELGRDMGAYGSG